MDEEWFVKKLMPFVAVVVNLYLVFLVFMVIFGQ